MKKRAAFKTLGCRLNQYETDAIVTDFHEAGYEIVDFSQPADVYIVNTCTVTNQGDHKSRQAISKNRGPMQNNALTIVTGCMVSNKKGPFLTENANTYIIDNKHKTHVFSVADAHLRGEIADISSMPEDVFGFSIVKKGFHTRSTVKIQDGCDNFCTYCIVPAVRGRAVSRPADEVTDNVKRLIDGGAKEIVLTGVNICRYKYGHVGFDDLVERIISVPGDFRVRISSIEPEGFTEKFIDLFSNPKLCPNLHLCLQSGSDKILLQMRRFYTVKQFTGITELFRKKYPAFNFTTDVIVGFPGETDEDFDDTCRVAEQVGFSHIHTFKYSGRAGTRADRMHGQISEKIKNERSLVIRDISEKMKLHYRKQFIGKTQRILVERTRSRGGARGYGENYIPVIVASDKLLKNEFYEVKLGEILNDKEKTMKAGLV